MIPLRLHVRNFLSYRGNVSVDLANLGLACLSGDNGAGKSALLDAMTWAVWGESRAPRDAELITIGETEIEVTFEFRMGQREYRVMRRRTSSRPTLEFDTRTPGNENWLPIGGDAIRDTQARIIQELRLDYETFANSAFLRQGQADLFTQNKPSDRKRILAEILDLSGYDRLADAARTARRTRTQRLDNIQAQMGRNDLQLASRHEKEVQLAELDEKVTGSETRLRDLATAIDAMRDRLSSAEMAESVLERTNIRIARLNQQANEVTGNHQKALTERGKLAEFVSNEKTITAAVKEQRAWRLKADECSSTLSARQPLLARKQQLEQTIRQAASDHERQVALLRQTIDTHEKQLNELNVRSKEASQLEAELTGNRSRLESLPELNRELVELQEQTTERTGENASLRSRMEEIKSRIAALEKGAATCPVCRKPLGDGDHEHIEQEWTAEGKVLGDAFGANKTQIDTLTAEIKRLRKAIDDLEKLARVTAGIEAKFNQLRTELAKRESIQTSINEATSKAAELVSALGKGSFLPTERNELQAIEQQLADLPYDEAKHTEARQKSKDLERAERSLQQLERARADLETRASQIAEFESRLEELAKELDEAQQDAVRLARSLEGIEKIRAEHHTAIKERESLSNAMAEMERNRGGLRRQLEELNELEKEQASLRDESKQLSAEADAYGELTTAFGRNGIQAMVIENVLPELEDEANRILSRMTTKQLEVMFRTTREAVSSDSTIETLDIIIRDESGRRPYQMFSGGEAFRINFAIRVALSKLLARRAGASVDTLIIDEGFGTQDQHGRDGLVEAIQSVTRDFELILVITHVDELRYQFPHRIEVVKTDAGSRATLV